MRIPRRIRIALIALVILVLPIGVYAADALYHFMHNDHDAASIGIIGGSDGPTSIYISGNPLKVLIIPIAVFTVGLTLGYYIRAKHRK